MKGRKVQRFAARTVLLVGEGDAEENFLRHLKSLYVSRSSGVAVTIKNARGKGALHVVDYARRQRLNAAFDVTAALLDTDKDWSAATAKTAQQAKVHVLPCTPCLEAMLLSIKGIAVHGLNTDQLKKRFEQRFDTSASHMTLDKEFDLASIDACLKVQPQMKRLVHLLKHAEMID